MSEPKLREIQRAAAQQCCVTMDRLLSPDRTRPVADCRAIAMYLSRRLTSRSFTAIGYYFRRDHSTVIHAVRVVSGSEALLREAQAVELAIMGRQDIPAELITEH